MPAGGDRGSSLPPCQSISSPQLLHLLFNSIISGFLVLMEPRKGGLRVERMKKYVFKNMGLEQ